MLWHEQSWPAIQSIDKQTPVVIPLGSLEQHGRHLPLFVDTIQVTAVAERVEKKLADRILMLPTLWLGSSHHHIDFPGTVSVPPSLYSQNITSIARCVMHAGFRKLFFLNGHGGNEIPASQALTELVATDDEADAATLAFASWWRVGREALEPKKHNLATASISHACEFETSLTLAIRPDLVKQNDAREGEPVIKSPWASGSYPGGSRVSVFHRFHRLTAAGSMGKPSAATIEKGRSMLDAIVADVVEFLKDFAGWEQIPAIGPK